MPSIQIIDPISYQGWDDLVSSTKYNSFFHSSTWAKVLKEAYGYKPLYFTIIDKHKLIGLITVMEIKSILTGRRGVSLPFSDFCEPIISDQKNFNNLFKYVINFGKRSGWRYVEVRGGQKFFGNFPPSSHYYGHIIDLKQGEKNIFSCLRDSTRRNVKKAIRKGVEVNIYNSLESVKEFCRLQSLIRKHHGLPPQPFYFFKRIYEYVISKNEGIVILASINENIIAGAVCLNFNEKAIYKYAASDRAYQHLRANNLVMWEAIRWYCQNRFQTFEMGRTGTTNKGLDQFKMGWGTRKRLISYYKYSINKQNFVVDKSGIELVFQRIGRKIPMFLLKPIGFLAYKHAG